MLKLKVSKKDGPVLGFPETRRLNSTKEFKREYEIEIEEGLIGIQFHVSYFGPGKVIHFQYEKMTSDISGLQYKEDNTDIDIKYLIMKFAKSSSIEKDENANLLIESMRKNNI